MTDQRKLLEADLKALPMGARIAWGCKALIVSNFDKHPIFVDMVSGQVYTAEEIIDLNSEMTMWFKRLS